ncbi:D-isomer specific 2-hydroxyacid dehydrogenase NAD-binding protein [Saccharothrix espanaensis DSM 44229]|uniref:D-isomer specific 2-hydroxyacid dehydrogenase NAD-binding protein n=1 Tax=Saccharothrix espanaensis (strain ATCC 51144 / DSM 44229 / JCM 9112 / NBRC 15066 / NRRL 15764) TaxID=1179773 RepID=K0K2H9_SACES|nr:D-isomer specific 2-hydroxyacid dehydrogenase NAD-binding protein [Saccharothrix espanaensis DSM 44229]
MLVPDELGIHVLAGVEGVRPVLYAAGEDLPPEAADAEVLVPKFLQSTDPREFFGRLPKLRLVQLLSAGAERFIGTVPDGVLLSTCRGAHGGSTAEWAIGALLAIYRDFPAFDRARVDRRWDYHLTDTLQGKEILVVGAGDLGDQFRRRVEPFDATATLVGRTARDGVRGLDELPELLGSYDVVLVVVPLTDETTGMVDAKFLARMRDGAILVNAARGPVVDTDALVAELVSGRLRAALDVTEPEPLPEDHPLWSAPGLFLTPHVAGSCCGHAERAYAVVASEVERFARGEQPRNLVHGDY